jgi:hypothetical protein
LFTARGYWGFRKYLHGVPPHRARKPHQLVDRFALVAQGSEQPNDLSVRQPSRQQVLHRGFCFVASKSVPRFQFS